MVDYDYVGHVDRTNVVPRGAMVAIFTNEDINLVADLVTNTNDSHEFYSPLPSHIDRMEETIIIHKTEQKMISTEQSAEGGGGFQALDYMYSYIDIDPTLATYRGELTDAEDEFMKSVFDGPFSFGDYKKHITVGSGATEIFMIEGSASRDSIYVPPFPLDQAIPMKVRYVNKSFSVTAATGAHTDVNFTEWEKIVYKYWYTTRRLTSAEKSARNAGIRLSRTG